MSFRSYNHVHNIFTGNKFIKIINLIVFRFVTCENIMDMIVRSKYQKTPCPICGEPEKEIFKFPLKKLDNRLIIASKKEILIKG